MDQRTRDELRAGFELQLKHQFYLKPEFPFLHSMGCNHVFFPVKNEEMDFGFLILEWTPEQNYTWIGTWVDNEEELKRLQGALKEAENVGVQELWHRRTTLGFANEPDFLSE